MPPKQRGKSQSKKESSKAKDTDSTEAKSRDTLDEALQRRQKERKEKREVKWTPVFKRIGYFSLVFIIPAVLNYGALNQERGALIPQGAQLYDVGWGQKLMLQCTGKGSPTVILEAPIGQNSDIWTLVYPIIAEYTKVCVYDRAGLGFSDRAYTNTSEYANDFSEAAKDRDKTQPSTIERMVDDLHRLLTYASNQPRPFIFVSVDFSTFISRFYTQIYEHEVAGLFLLDPGIESLLDKSPEEEKEKTKSSNKQDLPSSWPEYWSTLILPRMQQVWLSSVVGFNRLALMVGLTSPVEEPSLMKRLPNRVLLRKKHFLCEPKHLSSAWYECYFMNESMSQLKTVFRVKPFPNHIPITIATYMDDDPHLAPALQKVWKDGHDQLLHTIHPNSKHVILPGSGYMTLYRHPQRVAEAVLTMVKRWRVSTATAA